MSKEIYDDSKNHVHNQAPHGFTLTQYYGGPKKGLCLQLTGNNCDDRTGYVGLTNNEVARLVTALKAWLNGDAKEIAP